MKVLNVPVHRLDRLVEETDANEIHLIGETGNANARFDVGSPQYEERKEWAVIGQHEVEERNGKRTLVIRKLKREVEWSTNPVKVEADAPADALAEVNRPVSVMVFHKRHLKWSATEAKRSSVLAYEKAAILNFRRALPDARPDDFGAIVIDWERKHVSLEQVPPDLFA